MDEGPTANSREDLLAKGEVDAFLAETMSNLSFKERQKGQEDLHGVSENITEQDDEIEKLLSEMENHLNKIKHGSIYELAESLCPSHVTNRDFRLMFLRGNRYDTKAASKQILKFLKMKEQLFGQEKLGKDITLEDLSEDDRVCFSNGSFQILSTTDRSNRHILFQMPGLRKFKRLENELRARYYLYMIALKSEETQLRGMIIVVYNLGNFQEQLNGVGFTEYTIQGLAIPLHFAGVHYCTEDIAQYGQARNFLNFLSVHPPSWARSRFQMHHGSHLECQYCLSTYGISTRDLPINSTNDAPILVNAHGWYKERCEKESFADLSQSDAPCTPQLNDVLFGRHKSQQEGNKMLRRVVESLAEAYDGANKGEKKDMAATVIREVEAAGGRFLKQNEADCRIWVEVSNSGAHEKVTQAFRNHRRAPPTKQKPPQVVVLDFYRPNDVLFGRHRNNDGNEYMRRRVLDLTAEYDQSTKFGKKVITDAIVREIQGLRGRFLAQRDEDDKWEKLPDDVARAKVSKQFSNNRRVRRNQM